MELSHVDERGHARMVDVSGKPRVTRAARARGTIRMSDETLKLVRENALGKGDVLATARIAGITGGKRTSDLIPLCHNIEIDQIEVNLELVEGGVAVEAQAVCTGKTGIEMEALTAVSLACLTVYDMCKAVDEDMRIEGIHLVEKSKNRVV